MPATAVTIGNFDGVHTGHAALVRRTRELAGPSGRVVALTFDPHPAAVLRGEAPARLTSLESRCEQLRGLGCDEVVRLEPTPELLSKSPHEFLRGLVDRFQPGFVVEGDDFRFGKGRAGDVKALADLGATLGFRAVVVPPVEVVLSDHLTVRASSSIVRWMLAQGRVADAGRVLGRPYELSGTVVQGDQVGRTLGFPTANLRTDCMIPADGIYAGIAEAPGGTFAAAVNIGTRPTFNGKGRRAEAHLMRLNNGHTHGALPGLPGYDWPLTIQFTAWIRDDARFESVEALVAQIERDCQRVHRVLEMNPCGAH